MAFGIIIAIVQIGGSFLLLFRKTLLLGAIILFSFLLNLMLINILYPMNAGALLQSVILTVGILFLLLLHHKILVACFIQAISNRPYASLQNPMPKNILRIAAITLSMLFILYLKSLLK